MWKFYNKIASTSNYLNQSVIGYIYTAWTKQDSYQNIDILSNQFILKTQGKTKDEIYGLLTTLVTNPYGQAATSAVYKNIISHEDLTPEEKHILKLELIPWATNLQWAEIVIAISCASYAMLYFIINSPVASEAIRQASSTLIDTVNCTTGMAMTLFNKLPTMYTSTYNTISPHATNLKNFCYTSVSELSNFTLNTIKNTYNYTAPVASEAIRQASSTLIDTVNCTTGMAMTLFNKLPTMYTSAITTISSYSTTCVKNPKLYLDKMLELMYNACNNGEFMNYTMLNKLIDTTKKGYCLSVGTAGELVKASSYLASFYMIAKTHNAGAVGAHQLSMKLPYADKVVSLFPYVVSLFPYADKVVSLFNKLKIPQIGHETLHTLNENLLQRVVPKAMLLDKSTAGVLGNAITLYYIATEYKSIHENAKTATLKLESIFEDSISFGICDDNPTGIFSYAFDS